MTFIDFQILSQPCTPRRTLMGGGMLMTVQVIYCCIQCSLPFILFPMWCSAWLTPVFPTSGSPAFSHHFCVRNLALSWPLKTWILTSIPLLTHQRLLWDQDRSAFKKLIGGRLNLFIHSQSHCELFIPVLLDSYILLMIWKSSFFSKMRFCEFISVECYTYVGL